MDRRVALFTLGSLLSVPLSPTAQAAAPRLKKIMGGLDHPWALEFLPGGTALVTERAGRLRHLVIDGMLSAPLNGLPKIYAEGQGGLLDVVASPLFVINRTIYFSFSEPRPKGNCTSVAKAVVDKSFRTLTNVRVIFRQNTLDTGDKHFGSRLVFDRKGQLFVTTGDRYVKRDMAQDPAKHLGKIIRIKPAGGASRDNPKKPGWAKAVWSIGHRNVQGAALHPDTGQLWTAEHGAMGGDEINTPKAGKNYGWPVITYGRDYDGSKIGIGTSKPGMEQPIKYWDPSIAPSGIAFYTGTRYSSWHGNLFVCALKGQHVVRLTLKGSKVIAEQKLFSGFARFRDIAQGPDGYLYVITDEDGPAGAVYRVV
jgi:aldose sugar dehydrogenase